ncbi:subtilase-type protease inhibitor [Streptomyces lavendulae subsp. lavendulae]|nr:subtilase-type protease inhibitor [Streptomyces lavendulae subsp. lavendulae]GLX29693.1 subtilase-type protease inhibitor [Streptomyces lavendulae subsp. lavendulae]
MRYRFAAVSAAALLCLAGATGMAEAKPTSLYAPSAMVFSVAQGDDASAPVLRAATLSCMPTAQGTHPDPKAACTALNSTGGTFDRLLAAPDTNRACPMHYAPVTVTAEGVWQGSRVAWKHTFSNACSMNATLNGNAVFAF